MSRDPNQDVVAAAVGPGAFLSVQEDSDIEPEKIPRAPGDLFITWD
jgi:hypothetical protein